ncbi:ATP-dependent helicase [Glycomyces luteolus]|uniref:ATP-dependent helicase n=1 Tax=Glycomyces luteolus TaxID=2670330 RepID=A0A9X3PCX3_9ACTN|nr:ATP-dependent helicase [Glycomyces luteolus]MDA1363066.1 ATP-dependent helicase [Glycomyces luteolus]
MTDSDLTEAQRVLVEADENLFVAACPGAGKTRAMVARFLKRTSEEHRRGVALVSFTNAAVDEVRSRCGDRTDVFKAPNFVGTFDSFIHRFLVTPLFVKFYKVHPRYVQSWSEIPSAKFRMDISRSADVNLKWFDFDDRLRATLNMAKVDRSFGDAAAKKQLEELRSVAEGRANWILGKLLRAGTVSCDIARFLAEIWLSNDNYRPIISGLIRSRFTEVIVDEVQDCGREELVILEFLRDLGIRIVAVGDLDQAIYEFRDATPAEVKAFGATLPLRTELVDNWRSSPAICAFNDSLRSQVMTERAAGPSAGTGFPVHLIRYANPDEILPAALSLAEQHDAEPGDLVLLAHKRTDAMRAAGIASSKDFSWKGVASVADAGIKLRSAATDASTRRDAIRRVERNLLTVIADGRDLQHMSTEGICDELGIDGRRLRELAVRTAVTLSVREKSRSQFAQEVRAYFRAVPWTDLNITTPRLDRLGKQFQAPDEKIWERISAQSKALVQGSTVHGVKGREFRAVGLVIPKPRKSNERSSRTVLDDWEQGLDSEARRVLYVGGSRAQDLLMLFVHEQQSGQVGQILKRSHVPVVQLEAGPLRNSIKP